MKYGILFAITSLLLIVLAVWKQGWTLLAIWPALSLAIASAGYLGLGAGIFGKQKNGSQSQFNQFLMLPYLLVNWLAWHIMRLVLTEPAFHQIDEDIYVGRRMLGHELPEGMASVIDLTCEFPEPSAIRKTDGYIAFPILDAHVVDAAELCEFVGRLKLLKKPLFIHCAQGHGRTGLITSLLLIAQGKANDVDSALKMLQDQRPKLNINSIQLSVANEAAGILSKSN